MWRFAWHVCLQTSIALSTAFWACFIGTRFHKLMRLLSCERIHKSWVKQWFTWWNHTFCSLLPLRLGFTEHMVKPSSLESSRALRSRPLPTCRLFGKISISSTPKIAKWRIRLGKAVAAVAADATLVQMLNGGPACWTQSLSTSQPSQLILPTCPQVTLVESNLGEMMKHCQH